jgi:1,2-diacylglycerol 3-beta-galactosyltransferase
LITWKKTCLLKIIKAEIMTKKKKILVLTADAGFGHRSAAAAIQAGLEEKYGGDCQVDIANPMDDKRTPFFLRDSQTDYDKIVKNAPELYRLGYDVSDAPVPTAIMESTLTLLLFEVLRDLIMEKMPDVIVSTYPLYQAPFDAIFKVYRVNIPYFTIITDLVDVHRIWFSNAVTGCLVPTLQIKEQAVASGIPEEKIHITGIPVQPGVVKEDRTKKAIREDLGWKPELLTILVVGSKRVSSMVETLEVLNHFGKPLQLAVSAGNDDELFEELQSIKWHQETRLYQFVDNMAEMMHAADAVVCKAGGLIVTESLACGLPMLLIDILPGQERGNAEYVLSGGAGDLAKSQIETLLILSHWFNDECKLLNVRARASKNLGRPDSAYKAAEIIWENAARASSLKKRRIVGRSLLLQFLEKNKIDLQKTLTNRLR